MRQAGPLSFSRSGPRQKIILDAWITFYHVNPRFRYVVYYRFLRNQWIIHYVFVPPTRTRCVTCDALKKMMNGWMDGWMDDFVARRTYPHV